MKFLPTLVLLVSATVFLTACNLNPAANLDNTLPPSTPAPITTEASPNPSTTPTTGSKVKGYTLSDIASHDSADDCWMAVDGSVYDVTSFVTQHPGGDDILKGCGRDASAYYKEVDEHEGPQARSLLPQFEIGVLQ